jgi:hypothetical protein
MADKIVREFSAVGPCLTLGKLVRETPRFWVFNEWRGGDHYADKEKRISKRTPEHYSGSHVEPCPSCRDHPRTQYPNGYEN